MVESLAELLHMLHSTGLVHRDLCVARHTLAARMLAWCRLRLFATVLL